MKFDNRDNYIKLGLKISYYRKLKGLTQEQLAEILDMSTAFIGKIEAPNIVKAVSLDTLFEIARILGIPAYKLLFFEED
ncbi:MAG: helix-turn-helix domain-containing protein [Candidatus Gastranaerophilaceae bacterium]|jgi:transcriptional regulator with XRE-family HTH domain|nr:helix-turn-helix transcriptional regulator [Christensenellales bacterium]